MHRIGGRAENTQNMRPPKFVSANTHAFLVGLPRSGTTPRPFDSGMATLRPKEMFVRNKFWDGCGVHGATEERVEELQTQHLDAWSVLREHVWPFFHGPHTLTNLPMQATARPLSSTTCSPGDGRSAGVSQPLHIFASCCESTVPSTSTSLQHNTSQLSQQNLRPRTH